MSEEIIRLQDVWKIYHLDKVEVQAVRGVSLTIGKGEFVAIVGPSGSGKSTMMNLVGALDIPTKGHIFLKGRDIAHMTESELAQIRGRTIGFVFQQFHLLPTLTAQGNVELPMIFQGVSAEKRAERALELLQKVGLGHRVGHRPSELSGGERQRVAIARALANDPDVILADEPTGNLDSHNGKQIMNLLMHLHNTEKKTVIMVTHDLQLVTDHLRIVRLKDGEIVDGKHKKH